MSRATSNRKGKIGHNSLAADVLKSVIQRLDRIDEEITGLRDDKKEVLSEAKGNGFDTKTIHRLRKLMALDAQEREEQQLLLETYAKAMGIDPFS